MASSNLGSDLGGDVALTASSKLRASKGSTGTEIGSLFESGALCEASTIGGCGSVAFSSISRDGVTSEVCVEEVGRAERCSDEEEEGKVVVVRCAGANDAIADRGDNGSWEKGEG